MMASDLQDAGQALDAPCEQRGARAAATSGHVASGRRLDQAFLRACSSTRLSQSFYRPEFVRTDAGGPQFVSTTCNARANPSNNPSNNPSDNPATADADATMTDAIESLLRGLQENGDTGLNVRLVRDLISLAASGGLLAAMGYALYSQDERARDDFTIANNPLGNPVLDWGMVLLEWSKAVITSSLSYPTLRRHHSVDEYVKRLELAMVLLRACVRGTRAAGTEAARTSPMATTASRSRAIGIGALRRLEKGRDFATPFTVINAVIPPVRGFLLCCELLGASAASGSWRGLLRVLQSTSDCVRSVGSTIGTGSRNRLFAAGLAQIEAELAQLHAECRDVRPDAGAIVQRLAKAELLFACCSTRLLAKLCATGTCIAALLDDAEPMTTPAALREFLEAQNISFVARPGDESFDELACDTLHDKTPENHWGERLVESGYRMSGNGNNGGSGGGMVGNSGGSSGAIGRNGGGGSDSPGIWFRAPFRLVLELQYLAATLPERLIGWSRGRDGLGTRPDSAVAQP
jgi:uncharacterized membrane protein YgcG